jgi:hypothetical protein
MLIFFNRREAFVSMKILMLMRRLDSLLSTGVRGLKIVGMKNVKIYCWIHVIGKPLVVLILSLRGPLISLLVKATMEL